MRPEGREPLPDKAGESTLLSRSGGGSGSGSQKGFLLAHPRSGDRSGEDGELFFGAGGRAANNLKIQLKTISLNITSTNKILD